MQKKARKTRRGLIAEQEKAAMRLVNKANSQECPLVNLKSFHEYKAKDGSVVEVTCSRANDLLPETVSWIVDLMERNMKEMYERSSFGWDIKAKRDELFHITSWYLLATCEGKVIGFSHFRFDLDYGVHVLYCYEIQLEVASRRKGLGCFLMQALESIAFQNQMRKVVLTVFKFNPAAISFFCSLGYRVDNTNPSPSGNFDYTIFSKQNLCLVDPKIN